MPSDSADDQTARELLSLFGTGRQSNDITVPDMASASRITHRIRELREARGESVVGRKIGFSNKLIWAHYNIDRPIWNYVWDTTMFGIPEAGASMDLTGFPEPRIEPEVVFHLAKTPAPGMNEQELIACVDRVAHGFEIVQSIYPDWKFNAASSAAACGLHGALVLGPWNDVEQNPDEWGRQLGDFTVNLKKDGVLVDTGHARNVLGGPLTALRNLVETIASEPQGVPLTAGELVTTGTLTEAHPVKPGELWTTVFKGIGLTGLRLRFR